ncbi:ATP-binding protein [Lentilitoribacter sp. Alg239-R112]|uniref:sensor histidine kinase n=1 Tax=Lentilitoribacter sp. Alg239-R112 TaxID=2305987 RepID=UPI0013A6ACC9|nr:ATP-binding protein [Lentilitoribacter sp. Alg239-R112]
MDHTFSKTRRSVIVALMVITLISIAVLFVSAVSYFRGEEVSEANARLSLYTRSVNETLQRFQHLPYVLARDALVVSVAGQDKRPDILNIRLRQYADEASLEAIYLMDGQGLVLSASNFAQKQSFIGKNYGFRPYFLSSSEGNRGEFFGVGATTGRPGYFVSETVTSYDGDFLGVIAIKLDMSELQAAWEAAAERVFVSNADGVVVLSSNKDWLYKLLKPLNEQQLDEIKKGRQFGDQNLELLDWQQDTQNEATFQNDRFIYVSNPSDRLGWTVHYLLDEKRIYERATLTTAIFGVAIICLVLFSTFLRSRRIGTALQISQNDREQLRVANAELEMAQTELEKTSKLAALGQLSASVTHELGQPISALRNYLTAAEISGDIANEQTRLKLFRVTERMENITKQLRFFIRSNDDGFQQVDLRKVASVAIELLEHKVDAAKVMLTTQLGDAPALVMGNQLRLEQVIVNLVSNSIGAIEDEEGGQIDISIEASGKYVILKVKDNGVGFGDRSLEILTEPFHTTKASGEGMGLGLSIASEIIREHNGKITAETPAEGGSCFSIFLPAINP